MRKTVFMYVKKGNIYLKVYISETWSKTLNLILLHLTEYQNIHIFNLKSFPGNSVSSISRLWTPQFSCSVLSDSLWPHGLQHARPPCPSPTPSLFKLISIESLMPSNHLILCCPLLLPPSIFPSIRVFSNESLLHIRWPKCCSFSFNISSSNKYSGLISFRID